MIRFRLGQSWKHEGEGSEPSDAISLELDGVDLLAGAKDEPLTRVVPLGVASELLRGPLTLVVLELAQAAARCGDALVRDVRERSHEMSRSSRLTQLQSHARRLASAQHAKATREVDPGAFSHLEIP